MRKLGKLRPDEIGGFEGDVRQPGDSRCVLVVRPRRQSKAALKSSPFTNAPIQTGGFGGAMNDCGYAGGDRGLVRIW